MSGNTQTLPPNVPSNGLIAWYPFNGNANDESTFNNDGNLFGGVSLTTDRFGNQNSAYDFDGVDDFIEIPAPNELVFGNSDNFSINLWFKPVEFDPNTKEHLFKKYGCPYGAGQDIITLDFYDTIRVKLRQDGISTGNITGSQVSPCYDWQMITMVKDAIADSLHYYLNGQLFNSISIPNSSNSSSVPYYFGMSRWCTNPPNNLVPIFHYEGKIDDTGVWDRKLTSSEIQNLFDISFSNISFFGLDSNNLCLGDILTGYSADTNNVFSKTWVVNTPDTSFTQNNDTFQIQIQSGGYYEFKLYRNSTICPDSVTYSFTLDSFPDISIVPPVSNSCGDSLYVIGADSGFTYLWNTSSTDSFTLVNDTGLYTVQVTSPANC
ncbi:LamG domain-containing protein, partial [Salibacter halophilus]